MPTETEVGNVDSAGLPPLRRTIIIHTTATVLFLAFFLKGVTYFEKVFKDFDAELPGPTLLMLSLTNLIVRFWYVLPLLLIGELVLIGLIRKDEPALAKSMSIAYLLTLISLIMFAAFANVLPLIALWQKLS